MSTIFDFHEVNEADVQIIRDSMLVDYGWYLINYPDVFDSMTDPIIHYISYGAREGRNPNEWFHTTWYLTKYPDVLAAGQNPLLHYLKEGAQEGRDPCPDFHSAWYIAQYEDVRVAKTNPLAHYIWWGIIEGRVPRAIVNET